MYFTETKCETWPEERIIDRLHRCRRLLLLFDVIDAKTDKAAFDKTDAIQERLNSINEEDD